MTITAVLWDVDDTLFDHTGAMRRAAVEHVTAAGLLRRYGSAEEAADQWEAVTEEYADRFISGEFTLAESRRERFRAILGKPLTDGEADAWFTAYYGYYRSHWRAFPDVRPALDALMPGYRHGVLSNNAASQQDDKLRTIGIRDRFEVLVCSAELGVAKPDPAAFHAACASLGLPPEEVAYVGDRHDVDAAGADAAGLTGVWLDRRGMAGRSGVRRITGLAELATVVGGR